MYRTHNAERMLGEFDLIERHGKKAGVYTSQYFIKVKNIYCS